MKRRVLLCLVMLLCFCLLCAGCGKAPDAEADAPPAPDAQEPLDQPAKMLRIGAVVDAVVVNVRIEPSTDARILDTVQRGDMLEVVSGPSDGWCEVRCRGDLAYISADYLYISEWKDGTVVTVGTVDGGDGAVNVRKSPSTTGDILFVAEKNEHFLLLEENSSQGWHQVSYRGEAAYISAEFLTLKRTTINDALYGE